MTPTLDQLLDEPQLSFIPLSGAVDVEAVATAILGIGFAYRDEVDPSRFAVFSSAAFRDACRDERRADPTSPFPFVLCVMVLPDVVVVFPQAGQADLRDLSAQLVTWLTGAYEWRIENEFGTDMSDPAAHFVDTPAADAPAG
jgi:hypothetical protein